MKPPVPLKIFAVNSSPCTGGASKTELMLNHLMTGMREAKSPSTMDRIRQPTVDPKQYAQMGALFWKSRIAESGCFSKRRMAECRSETP